jgi:hypothetical protein
MTPIDGEVAEVDAVADDLRAQLVTVIREREEAVARCLKYVHDVDEARRVAIAAEKERDEARAAAGAAMYWDDIRRENARLREEIKSLNSIIDAHRWVKP